MLRRSLFAVVAFALLAPVEPFLLQPSRALAGGAASVLTYHAQTFGVGVVPAAAAVGLASGVALPAWRLPLYCGAFAGMSSAHLLSCQLAALAGGIASGCVLPLFDAKSHFVGHGGRLGYASMVATALTWALFVVSAGAAPLNIDTNWHGIPGDFGDSRRFRATGPVRLPLQSQCCTGATCPAPPVIL